MGESNQVAFVLGARVGDQEVTPGTIGFSLFNQFNEEVEEFLAGSQRRMPMDDVRFEIRAGSYQLLLTLPAILLAAVVADLRKLRREDSLDEIDPKRAEIIAKWQKRALSTPGYRVDINSRDNVFHTVRINGDTEYHTPDDDQWVNIEKYVVGTVVDIGGVTAANVHLKEDDTGQRIVAASSEEYLRDQKENVLYRKVQIHVTARENLKTGKLEDIRLISFVGKGPSYDEAELETAIERGTRAWASIPNSSSWVRDLRGRDDD